MQASVKELKGRRRTSLLLNNTSTANKQVEGRGKSVCVRERDEEQREVSCSIKAKGNVVICFCSCHISPLVGLHAPGSLAHFSFSPTLSREREEKEVQANVRKILCKEDESLSPNP
jgi:hypothetical protein